MSHHGLGPPCGAGGLHSREMKAMTPQKPPGAVRLVSWNVNGLRSILQKGFLDFLQTCDADAVCVQEIKAKPEQVAGVEWPEGWRVAWNPAQRPGYSGVAIFYREAEGPAQAGMGQEEHDAEGRILVLPVAGVQLVTVYVPNAQRELTRLAYRAERWSPAFRDFLAERVRSGPVVVCGDFNVAHEEIDLARPKENVGNAGFTHEERTCFRELLADGFLDTFREFEAGGGHYTWWSYQNSARPRNIGWRIDYFLASQELRPALLGAHIWPHIAGSDHCPIALDLRRSLSGHIQ